MLPVAPAGSPPTPKSKITAFGKIPSALTSDGRGYGIAKWQSKTITPQELAVWAADPRLSFCVRCAAVRAIDIDITEPETARAAALTVELFFNNLGLCWAERLRSNSPKCLFALRMDGVFHKRIIDAGERGRIEFLGDGQQFVACGSHPSGVEYEWTEFSDIPTLTPDQFEDLWGLLASQFGVSTDAAAPAGATFTPATEISAADRDALMDALEWPPLIAAAEDNDTWSEVGYALLSIGAVDLWMNFCASAPKYDADAAMAWWRAHQDATPRTDFTHIILMAKRLGYKTVEFGDLIANPMADDEKSSLEGLIGELPEKHFAITDQANAHRLKDAFGGRRIIVVNGGFFSWTGRYWKGDDTEAYRCAAELTNIIGHEIDANPNSPDAAPLRKWQMACEQVSVQNRAVELLRKTMEPYEAINLDSAKHLFNVSNGTIDLRTGLLQPHEPRDFITRIARVPYEPDAPCPVFEGFILGIMGGDAEMVSFLQRWFGYGMTAETREQKIMLHIGGGSNGKSTLLEAIARVMGEYGKTAAPNLLTSNGDRHPTEIAELFGRRLVTAHESDDGAVLRESFIKQATGGDPLSGRFMRQDFFEFFPTHKLQLLTNHKPQIRGQDHAIWRRILLVWYTQRYGTREAVEAGLASAVGDPKLTEKLELERKGILAWLVRGAIEWYRDGLNPPASVIEAGLQYQREQDRTACFVAERCQLSADFWSAIDDLYHEYRDWSYSCGYHATSVQKFVTELERVMGPAFKRASQNGRRGAFGIALNPDNGFRSSSSNSEDLV
jgi:P4 family phage/plasmid primase-like protien